MRCGCPVEIGGFRWNPEEIDSYKIDYSEDHSKGYRGWQSRANGLAHMTAVQAPPIGGIAIQCKVSARIHNPKSGVR
jgi:hypothetical protein